MLHVYSSYLLRSNRTERCCVYLLFLFYFLLLFARKSRSDHRLVVEVRYRHDSDVVDNGGQRRIVFLYWCTSSMFQIIVCICLCACVYNIYYLARHIDTVRCWNHDCMITIFEHMHNVNVHKRQTTQTLWPCNAMYVRTCLLSKVFFSCLVSDRSRRLYSNGHWRQCVCHYRPCHLNHCFQSYRISQQQQKMKIAEQQVQHNDKIDRGTFEPTSHSKYFWFRYFRLNTNTCMRV